MARKTDPARKPELLAAIVDHLREHPLTGVTFRTLADALGVSPFTLVYHFGTRNELIIEIIRAVTARQQQVIDAELAVEPSLDSHIDAIRASWLGFLVPTTRALLRLEFEAALMEVTDPTLRAGGRDVHARWVEWGTQALERLGVRSDEAAIEARILVDQLYGFQLDLVVTRDDAGATAAFDRALDAYRDRVAALIAVPAA